ncbi:unnamed protein product [Caenorhabditis angaria]|uniref:Uncharacterized protein n=1 Tax=Caenorhabditis angaria TaxID=860376 RepID=A0A9P1N2H9_9PELO|nr:unnamed protein product [Caenorhabditis angaria]
MKLTIENVKKLFQVMILMSAKSSGTFEIDELIFNFLAAQNEKERFFGVLAMIMKVQCEMAKKHTEAQETAIQESLTKIETATKSSSILRGAFYAHFAEIVKNHRRNEEIRCVSKFAAKIGTIFKTQFFTEPEDGAMGFVLKPDEERFLEVVPMFNLIKELCVLQNRWHEDDDDSMQSSYDINILTELNFTIEAQIFTHPASSEVTRDEKMRQQFFVIQWCRSLLNAFFGQSSIDENISKSSLKIFYQMMDAEKRLLQNIQNVATWRIPNLDFENFEIEAAAKPGKRRAKKRKINEENEVLVEEEAVEEKENVDDLGLEANLREYYVPLKIRPVSHLLQLARTKRSCLIYLCNELSKIIQDLIKMRAKKSISGFLAQRQQTTPTKPCGRQKIDKFYHGDSLTIWNCIKKSMEEIWSIIENVFEFFEHLEENVENSGEKLERDMENLVEKCLKILNFVLGAELFGNPNEKLTNAEKNEKKSVIFMILERKINAESASATSKSDPEAARFEIAKYLLKNAKNAMNPTIAQLILETFENLKISPEKSELSRNMAKFALSYLKKDWSGSSDGKGARFNSAARDILRHYISLRKENEQISAIKWLLTNKVVQLVPDTDKRQSTVLSQQSEDVLMEKEDENAPFYCINKSTFPFIFKTLFSMLNSCVTKKELSAQALKSDQITEEDSLTYWENASSCFLILCLLLRVAKIRTVNVLYTAIKEGKQFFINVSRKSSFIYLVDNITTGQNFEIISTKIERIITAIQNGNRVLQAIGTYAKTSKCVNLLKKFPELRAESENCLRIIHSAMVKNECLDAFTVGRLKGRDIDGGIITENRDSGDE